MRSDLKDKKVLVYTSVSTKNQKDFERSLSAQKKSISNFCIANQMEILEYFEEDFSLKNFNRPVFNQLKDFTKKIKVK